MKIKNKCLLITSLLLFSSLSFVGCNNKNNTSSSEETPSKQEVFVDSKGEKIVADVDLYHNNDFNYSSNNGMPSLDGQWEDFGISSPYIMKYNGVYYLYSSTSFNHNDSGIRAWKSHDLIHFEKVDNGINPIGFVTKLTSGETLKARAPEVHYYNGSFYMYVSYNQGSGHFILKSDSPSGPFESLTKSSIDSKYDGTLTFDRDENPYFLTAGLGGISVSTTEGIDSIIETTQYIPSTNFSSSIYSESPSVFEYMGKYYLLYSSGQSKTSGYQIRYAVSDGWEDETPAGLASSFKKGATDTLLINADSSKGLVGLGHPSAILGPDLDSYYVAYDSLDSEQANLFGFNLDRLYVNGNLLSMNHNRYNALKPSLPAFSAYSKDEFVNKDNYYLSSSSSEDTFSIEFNFIHGEDSELIFAYQDENNYSYLKADVSNSVKLCKKENGAVNVLEEIEFYNFFKNEDLHMIRLAYRDGKLDLTFENSPKLRDYPISLKGGKIGYKAGANLDINYTCFSNVARNSASQNEFKQGEGEILANTYLNKAKGNFLANRFLEGSGLNKRKSLSYNDVEELILDNKYDFARYSSYFKKNANYLLTLTLDKKYLGKKMAISIDDGNDIELTIPKLTNKNNEDVVKVSLTTLPITSGLHQITIKNLDDTFGFISFNFHEIASKDISIYSSLSEENSVSNLHFSSDSRWMFQDGSMKSLLNYRNVALTNENNIADFNMKVTMNLSGDFSIFTADLKAGVLFRCNNYVSYEYYMESHTDIELWNNRIYDVQGYYLGVTSKKLYVYKLNVGVNDAQVLEEIDYNFDNKKEHEISILGRGSLFQISIDNNVVIVFEDPNVIPTGSIGLYSMGAEVTYKDFNVLTK